ncbi:L,D-transpeptidase family protein [Tabrizicola sp.]|jgi:murein L,D-transpeptidase YafK|uniref:L,D-transpeptidase family protein n=1 Tax=Tabrizicola sp. TaxID=2005166 RepID=UPI001A3D9B28|nr:L,D-transpeptidase family protein [Tabrizicola sp.]MBL9061069.1 L,D-transpeptidase family protein [Tabrizicola sp.]
MRFFGWLAILVAVIGLSGCGSKFKRYYGPEVTQVQVHKADRKMYLFHNEKVLKAYDIGLGFAPVGHKQFEGDGKTPEGQYFISYKNPDSQYHLSLGISYPNEADIAFAESQDKSPGGDIFIHGGPNTRVSKRDWTWGCVALTDKEIEIVYSMVKPGTPVFILP